MKGILKVTFICLLLIALNNQSAYGAQDMVKTYHSDWTESIYFKDGAKVLVTANDGGVTKGGSKIATAINLQSGATFTFTLSDEDYDGTYTGSFKVSTDPTINGSNLQLFDNQSADIVVDLDNLSDSGTVTIIADYTIPQISDLTASEKYFSPGASPGRKDTTIISFKSNEAGRYEIRIDANIIPGTNVGHTPDGTLSANTTVYFEWNGCDEYGGSFLEGTHTIRVRVWDKAENQSYIYAYNVWIDNTFPTEIYLSLTDDAFSPGTSPTKQDTTYIVILNDESTIIYYELSINGKILLGTGTPSEIGTGTGSISQKSIGIIEWGGRDETGTPFDEGTYTINLKVEDLAGNYTIINTGVTIDNTPPRIDYFIDDSGGNPCYLNQEVYFVLQVSDWIAGTIPVVADGGKGTTTFSIRELKLIDYGNGIYAETYVIVEEDVGTFTYFAYFEDKAGNVAINSGVMFGTITLKGNEYPPTTESRIVRLNILTPEIGTFSIIPANITLATSTMTIKSNEIKQGDKIKIKTTDNSHIWVTSAVKDGEITVSNANLFFGFPIANYNNIATFTIPEGARIKGIMKIADEVIINLTAVNILDTLGLPTRTSTSVIFKDSRIATGTMIVAYDYHNHIWLGTASESGKFEISNSNIYFGDLVEDYRKLGEIKGVIACFAIGGIAFANMGIIAQGISLYDNGAYTHKDIKAGDGVYSNCYTIKQLEDTKSYFYGYFIYADRDAENNGMSSQEQIVIDATPPNIVNFGAFPGIFRPGSENVTIKYTLIEESDVTIEIWDSVECIRRLTPPKPAYGDNCNAMWDGKNEGGVLVQDGTYYFKINAIDKAGNRAIERVGVIKATTIDIKIIGPEIIPSKFTPTPNIDDDEDFNIKIRAIVRATEAQLQNLDFEMDTNNIYTLPYLLVDLTCFDAKGNELRPVKLPDLTSDTDTDPFTNGYPNYYTGPGTETPRGWCPRLGTDLPDEGDGNKGNDWDTLVPLNRDPIDPNLYYMDWDVGIVDWEVPNGTYIIRLQVELVGSCWKFIDYRRDPNTDEPIAEIWHQKPNHGKGYSRTSKPVDGRVEVVDSPFTEPDYIAPVVIATDPGINTIHEPTENISIISAQLMDQGGSGIDFSLSTIILRNSVGVVIPGTLTNNGIDTMWWDLKEPLTTPDDYTIEVRPVDKAKNGLADPPQQFTFTILDRVGPEIGNILYDTPAEPNQVLEDKKIFGVNEIIRFSVVLSELGTRGKSKVDFITSKIIIRNELTGEEGEPHELFGGERNYYPFTENSGEIEYKGLTISEEGTYTIWVEAWDMATPSNRTYPIIKLTFYVSLKGYIPVEFKYPKIGTKTCLLIPPETKAYTITATGIIVSTYTITIRQGTITEENEGYTPIEPVIEFWWLDSEHIDIKLEPLSEGVITLTMYYGHITLPSGILPENLTIWVYDGYSWGKASDVYKEAAITNDITNKKIMVTFPKTTKITLENQYAIMYEAKAVDVKYYHYYKKKLVTCLKIPELTMVDGYVVGTNTVTVGTLTITRAGYVVIRPVLQFFFRGQQVTNKIEFNKEVELIMYYTEEDKKKLYERGLNEDNLVLAEYDGTAWTDITNKDFNLDPDKREITYRTKIIREKYAIMYIEPAVAVKPTVFKESVYAYPNPAKDGKVIFRYDLVKAAKVTIKIYTIMGDLVWSKEYPSTSPQGAQGSHGVYPADKDDIIWDCVNNAGKKVASGLYIYVLTASDESGEVSVTKKLIVIQ